jgi:DHA2 family multidrug resistance protein
MFATLVIQREYKTEQVRSFDFIGFVTVAAFLTSLLLALADANAAWNVGGWTSPFILTCLSISAVSLVIFLITEFTVEHPLIELSLFRDFNFAVANGVLFIFGLGMFGSTFLLPLYLQNALGYTAQQSGAVFLPVGVLQGTVAPLTGFLADRINPKIPALTGIGLLAFSLFLNSHLSLYSEHSQVMLALYLRGLGMGMVFTSLSTMALSGVPRNKMAQASGLFNVIRQVGGSFGIAFLGTMLTRRTLFHTAIYGQATDSNSPAFHQTALQLQHFVQQGVGGTASSASLRASSIIASHLGMEAFVQSINDDFLIAASITAVAIIPIAFLRWKKRTAAPRVEVME